MALRSGYDDGARCLRGAVVHRLLPVFRIQFHGIVGQKSGLVADVWLLREANRSRKRQAGSGNNGPGQVTKIEHAKPLSGVCQNMETIKSQAPADGKQSTHGTAGVSLCEFADVA